MNVLASIPRGVFTPSLARQETRAPSRRSWEELVFLFDDNFKDVALHSCVPAVIFMLIGYHYARQLPVICPEESWHSGVCQFNPVKVHQSVAQPRRCLYPALSISQWAEGFRVQRISRSLPAKLWEWGAEAPPQHRRCPRNPLHWGVTCRLGRARRAGYNELAPC